MWQFCGIMIGKNDIALLILPNNHCSIQARAGMYPKTLQYLMGHSDINVTMNTYTHLGLEDAVDEMNRMRQPESARKEQEALSGKTDEVKISKKHFRAG